MYDYRWNEWNVEHIAEHGITPTEAEHVVDNARPPYPEQTRNKKFLVRGNNANGDFLQVIYLVDPDGTIYIIHARPLTDREKRRYRRRHR